MHPHITSDEMRRRVEARLAANLTSEHPNLPNTKLIPRFVRADGEALTLELAFDTQDWMTNPMGVVHGGALAIVMDNAMGVACHCLCGVPTPTISMTLNYPRPVPLNAVVHVRVRIAVFGSTCAQVSAELFLPQAPDQALVFATGVYSTKGQKPQA